MIFGSIAVDEAEGVILAHSVSIASGKFGKGCRLTVADLDALRSHGVSSVIGCRMEPGDLDEDAAAAKLAAMLERPAMRCSPATTGRVNFYADANGLFVADKSVVDRFNRIDPAITLACLADHADVRAGDLVATIKIIPLAVAGHSVERACQVLYGHAAFQLKPYVAHSVVLIATTLPSLKPSVMDKTVRVLQQRLVSSGSELMSEARVPHGAGAVADAMQAALAVARSGEQASPAMIVVFGASAMSDPHDVIPEAIRLAGGTVVQVGLPVDPGNLLVLGYLGTVPVIGAPGCARSPKENGFDWVLNRLLAGEAPTRDEMTGLGVGGLLMEIPSRPLPRLMATPDRAGDGIAVVILAAGRASRMGDGGQHKLLAEFDGEALVHRVARQAIEAKIGPVHVVVGHRGDEISAALDGLDVTIIDNPHYATGMASSLKAGLERNDVSAAPGMMVLLADMPNVATGDIRALANAFASVSGTAIVRAVADGQRGNPVILPRSTFEALKAIEGDIGARPVIESAGLPVIDVEIGVAARLDVDTPDAVVAAGGILKD
ncbi:NTP transferase domain-containing protein [Rhizobium sp. SL42]|uniref:NTP transferase domain-containing protein n=1 Tax=Rhizobium sp. SL42 TaxID=2806346 RepID=UPI001F29F7E1|nr:molybdopterin-binding/glycosyltransferase family 2 protein [Rhizobium sp. SL42]UJW73938.1 molybdopterin-binding/glycosyltransferase family 2 protein [Rhizobium sp. SL42]